MSYVIRLRRGTSAEWTKENPLLLDGEIGYETDTRKFKVGDGTHRWTSLAHGFVGPPGPQGPPGAGLLVKGIVPNYANLPHSPNRYDFYLTADTGKGWFWNGDGWLDAGEIRGPSGAVGPSPEIKVSTVQQSPGTTPTVSISGHDGDYTITFGIPPGAQGPPGKDATWTQLTQAEYDLLVTRALVQSNTLYVIVG